MLSNGVVALPASSPNDVSYETKLAFAKEHKGYIIRNCLITMLNNLLPADREEYLTDLVVELTVEQFNVIVDMLRTGEFRRQFILKRPHLVTPDNLARMTMFYSIESKKQDEFIKMHETKIKDTNIINIINIFSENYYEKLIKNYLDRITSTNVVSLKQHISSKKFQQLLKKNPGLVTSENLAELVAQLPQNKRFDFIKAHADKITATNLASLAGKLLQKNAVTLIDNNLRLITANNIKEVMKIIPAEKLTQFMLDYAHLLAVSTIPASWIQISLLSRRATEFAPDLPSVPEHKEGLSPKF